MSVKVRYGYSGSNENSVRKNTLVTIRDGDILFFGISRCNLNTDCPNKNDGRFLATVRAQVALDDQWNAHEIDGTFEVHKSGLLGCVDIDDRDKLIRYFNNIDAIQINKVKYKS
jgi:hypothetical protein